MQPELNPGDSGAITELSLIEDSEEDCLWHGTSIWHCHKDVRHIVKHNFKL